MAKKKYFNKSVIAGYLASFLFLFIGKLLDRVDGTIPELIGGFIVTGAFFSIIILGVFLLSEL